MITGQLRNQIDQLWEKFWTGGITNPLTVIEQISFLMFARLLDIQETNNERMAARSGRPFKRLFPEDPDGQLLRWQNFRHLAGKDMLRHVKTNVFPHFAQVTLADTDFGEYMRDADMEIKSESLLVAAVEMIEKLPLTAGDTKGDLYEYLLFQADHRGHQRPVPHAAPHHRPDGRHDRPQARRNPLRSGLRHRRLPGARHGIPEPHPHLGRGAASGRRRP